MKIAMTGSEWFSERPGGLNRYFQDLYAALSSMGENVTGHAFGTPPIGGQSWGPAGGGKLARLTSLKPDLKLDENTILDRHFCLYGPPARGLHGKAKLVVHFHGPWASESRQAGHGDVISLIKKNIEQIRYRNASKFVVISQAFKTLLHENYSIPLPDIDVIPPGVDLSRFSVAKPKCGSNANVLTVRRLERRMGIDYLIRSWKIVTSHRPDAKLTIVGKGTYEKELRNLTATLGLNSHINFAGRVTDSELTGLYQECQFSVIPSVALEGFGLIALESLAAGRPPIVTNCGGLPDAVCDLDRTLIVPPADVDGLADRILSGLDGNMPSVGESRTHAEKFSWEKAAQRHVALYNGLMA